MFSKGNTLHSQTSVLTRQDSQKKSQGGNISPIWGEAPTSPIETKVCIVGHLADVITHAKLQDGIFMGYDFTGGRISHFLLIFAWALQQCSATALPVINNTDCCTRSYESGSNYTAVHGATTSHKLRLSCLLLSLPSSLSFSRHFFLSPSLPFTSLIVISLALYPSSPPFPVSPLKLPRRSAELLQRVWAESPAARQSV